MSMKAGVKNRMEPGDAATNSILQMYKDAEAWLKQHVDVGVQLRLSRRPHALFWRPDQGLFLGTLGLESRHHSECGLHVLAACASGLAELKRVGEDHASRHRAHLLQALSKAAQDVEDSTPLIPSKSLPPARKVTLTPTDEAPVKAKPISRRKRVQPLEPEGLYDEEETEAPASEEEEDLGDFDVPAEASPELMSAINKLKESHARTQRPRPSVPPALPGSSRGDSLPSRDPGAEVPVGVVDPVPVASRRSKAGKAPGKKD